MSDVDNQLLYAVFCYGYLKIDKYLYSLFIKKRKRDLELQNRTCGAVKFQSTLGPKVRKN